jgi:hypothetical protein
MSTAIETMSTFSAPRAASALLFLAALSPITALADDAGTGHDETSPESSDTLVLPTKEESISGFSKLRNWTSSECSGSQSWKTWNGKWDAAKKSGEITKSGSNPTLIVIHETGDDGSAFTRRDVGIHFVVKRDGTVCQLAPISRRYTHAPEGSRSIGIEVSNGSNVAGHNYSDTSAGNGSHCTDNLKIGWKGMFEKYHCLPTEDQLQSLHTLVSTLQSKLGIAKTVGNTAAVGSGLFMLNAQGKSYGAMLTSMEATKGVVSHGVMSGNHGDGGLETLYLWLRTFTADHDIALCKMKAIAQRDPVKWAALPASIQGKLDYEAFTNYVTVARVDDAASAWCTNGSPPAPPAQYTPDRTECTPADGEEEGSE